MIRGHILFHGSPLKFSLFFCVFAIAQISVATQADEAGYQKIDRLIAIATLGPTAPIADDGEFLRRIHLDLTGRIPSIGQTRTFLADSDANKRVALIDQLLGSPEFSRHMANVFDVMLMERRNGADVPGAEWQKYLFEFISANRPLNELAKEILSADGVDPAKRPAVKFYLDRQAEPNLITRDIGRVFFGKDFQCAQCHDHPLIEDYYQADYYGIYAFVNRGVLFRDKKDKNKGYFAEKADGDVSFNSVFTKIAGRTGPRLPEDVPMTEPSIKRGEEYVVAPATDVRPVPKYSRRGQLAQLATNGGSRAFNRNIANRLWAHMLGRGIVEPVDLHHSDNPPSHPELLEFLTDEIVATKFDLRAYLRQIALSQTYQRGYELRPNVMTVDVSALQQLPAIEAQFAKQNAAVTDAKKAQIEATKKLDETEKASLPTQEKLTKANAAVAAAQASVDKALKPYQDAQKLFTDRQEVVSAVSAAAAKAQEAIAKLPDDKELAAAAEKFKAKADALTKELAGLAKKAEALAEPAKKAQDALAVAIKETESPQKEMDVIQAEVDRLRRQWVEISNRSQAVNQTAKHLEAKISDLKLLAQWDTARAELEKLRTTQTSDDDHAKLAADQLACDNLQAEVTQRLAQRFFASNLRPLAPEALGWSLMQAAGILQQNRAAVEAELNKKTPLDPSKPLSDAQARERQQAIEQATHAKLAGSLGAFVTLFGGADGQPQNEFYATVDQALFFGNGSVVRGWLAPSGDNLTARLVKLEDPKLLADELYLSVLTRSATEAETTAVANYLSSRPTEKPAVVQELAWGLMTSSEFRFNH